MKKKLARDRFWEWFRRPARRLEHLRIEGFTESEVDGFVLRISLQNAAFVLIAAGLLGGVVFALAWIHRWLGIAAAAVYGTLVAVYVGVNLFSVALHLLIVTQRYLQLRHEGASLTEFGHYPLKVAASAVAVLVQAGLIALVIMLYLRLVPE